MADPSGGAISTDRIGAAALIRMTESALQAMEKAGDRGVEEADLAIATGFGGSWWTDLSILEGGQN